MTKYHSHADIDGYINIRTIDNIVKVDCSTADGERLCLDVLDSADWAESLGNDEYCIASAEAMATLIEFVRYYNDTASAEYRNRLMTDWTLVDAESETDISIDGDYIHQSCGNRDRFEPDGMWGWVEEYLRANDPDGGREHKIVVENEMVELWYAAKFDGENWDTTLI